ncbi:MAG: two-component system response regulator, partial [Coriobacteriales bacterium]|nr:two-component system response regulator [Coriobacteriales bacterium]
PAARVIVVSAIRSEPLKSQAISEGAAEYLTKPFQPSRIIDAVRRTLHPALG